jgi:hypothetical protein
MNLYPTASDPEVPLAPADWTMTMGSVGRGDMVYYYADVLRERAQICRIGYSGPPTSEDEVQHRLATKARLWIDDYLSRPHSGSTELGSLT